MKNFLDSKPVKIVTIVGTALFAAFSAFGEQKAREENKNLLRRIETLEKKMQ